MNGKVKSTKNIEIKFHILLKASDFTDQGQVFSTTDLRNRGVSHFGSAIHIVSANFGSAINH